MTGLADLVNEAPESASIAAQVKSLVHDVQSFKPDLFYNSAGKTFITLPITDPSGRGKHFENWPIRSDGMDRFLRTYSWNVKNNQVLTARVVAETQNTLDAIAMNQGERLETNIRVAHVDGSVFVDMANDRWQAVQITANGWSIVDNPPVKFIRSSGTFPLPVPQRGGNINELRKFINAKDESTWRKCVAWLLATYSAGPYPVLVVQGEQGASKSSLCRCLRKLVDPHKVEFSKTPREDRDVVIAAENSHAVMFENLSSVPGWLSDLLCSIATGAADRQRQYHTNDGREVLFQSKNPIALNGISLASGLRPDLLDRALILNIPNIPEEEKRSEHDLNAEFEKEAPKILGAIFDVISAILRERPYVRLDAMPRMADFAIWITAAEQRLGWEKGSFMELYQRNRQDTAASSIETDQFASALVELIETEKSWHKGALNQLLSDLSTRYQYTEAGYRHLPQDWPKSAKACSNYLARLRPALRQLGVHYRRPDEGARSSDARIWELWFEEPQPSIKKSSSHTKLNLPCPI